MATWALKTRALKSEEPVATICEFGCHATAKTVDLCFLIIFETHQLLSCS